MRKLIMWFPKRFDTNRAVQALKMALDLESREIVLSVALINAKLICAFVFAYAKC